MNKLKVTLPSKTEEIGDSLNNINLAFNTLKVYLRNLNNVKKNGENLIDSVNFWYNDLKYCFDFMNKNNSKYLELFEEVLNKRSFLIKPLMLMYTSKFRSDVGAYTNVYIQNVIHDWITRFYPIKTNNSDKPNYAEGQKAVVFYLRSEENSLETRTNDSDSIVCVTSDINVTARCKSTRTGQVCINGCGCVSCAGEIHCNKTERVNCYYADNNARQARVRRSLTLQMKYQYNDYPETKFGFVRLIVDNCEWKVDNTVPVSTPTVPPEEQDKGIITLKNNKQLRTFDKLDIDPF